MLPVFPNPPGIGTNRFPRALRSDEIPFRTMFNLSRIHRDKHPLQRQFLLCLRPFRDMLSPVLLYRRVLAFYHASTRMRKLWFRRKGIQNLLAKQNIRPLIRRVSDAALGIVATHFVFDFAIIVIADSVEVYVGQKPSYKCLLVLIVRHFNPPNPFVQSNCKTIPAKNAPSENTFVRRSCRFPHL